MLWSDPLGEWLNGDQDDQLITICIFDSTAVTFGINQAVQVKAKNFVKMPLKVAKTADFLK